MTSSVAQEAAAKLETYVDELTAAINFHDNRYSQDHLDLTRVKRVLKVDERYLSGLDLLRATAEREYAKAAAAATSDQLVKPVAEDVERAWARIQPVIDAGKHHLMLLETASFFEILAMLSRLPRHWEARQLERGKEPTPREVTDFTEELTRNCHNRILNLDTAPREVQTAISDYRKARHVLDSVEACQDAAGGIRTGRELSMKTHNEVYTLSSELGPKVVKAQFDAANNQRERQAVLAVARDKLLLDDPSLGHYFQETINYAAS